MKMKKALAFLMAVSLVLGMISFASADTLSDIQKKGVLVVGASVGFPPYEFYFTNPETGKEEYAGFDMKLAQGIAEMLGVKLEISDQSFAGLITALRAGEIDMIVSGMAIKPERLEVVDFSTSYYTGTQIMLVRAADYDTLNTVEAMAGKKVGAQMGSLQAGILDDQFASCEPLVMDNITLLVMDLLQGSLDGVLLTDTVAKTYMALNLDADGNSLLAISEVPVIYDNGSGVGVAVAKGDNESLLKLVNEYIAKIKSDGTFDGWVDEATAQNAMLLSTDK